MATVATEEISPVVLDPARLAALEETALLDTPPQESYDRLVRLASKLLDAPVALVSLVDHDRQFFKSQTGLTGSVAQARQTPLSHSFCQHVVASGEPLVVDDARIHPVLKTNLAIRDFQVISYLGVPLRTDSGQTLGSLCTIDAKPRHWSDENIETLRDIGELVMTEIEMRAFARRLQQNYLELRERDLHRDELIHMIIHDLRNPLSSVIMGLDSITVSNNDKEILQIAKNGAANLYQLISQILDESRAEAGKLTLNREHVSPTALLNEAIAQVVNLARSLRIHIEINTKGAPESFHADPQKIRRVLVNLLSNSIQHTPSNGQITVEISTDASRQNILFSITDTGMGIDPKNFKRIFEKFGAFKIQQKKKDSTGLGLPFCKLAIEAHGGEITVQSEPGHGTTFSFRIPLS